MEAQGSIRGTVRAKQAPLHPANLPPERFIGLSLSSSYSPLNNFADIHSLIFLLPIQDRAPPHFA